MDEDAEDGQRVGICSRSLVCQMIVDTDISTRLGD